MYIFLKLPFSACEVDSDLDTKLRYCSINQGMVEQIRLELQMMTQPPTTETTQSNLKHANNQTLSSPSLNLLQTLTQHTHIFINTHAHTHRHTPLYNYDKLYNYPLCSTVS